MSFHKKETEKIELVARPGLHNVPFQESLILGFARSDLWAFQITAQGRGNYFFLPTQKILRFERFVYLLVV